jgi:sn-glycerol 3-phosphate transport system substrate-binding protein
VLLNEGNRQGTNYWIPFARSTPLFYYNKDIWAEAGLPDRAPANWDEFMEWAPELVQMEGDTMTRAAFVHPNSASYIAWLFQGVTWQFNGQYSLPDFTMTMTDENTCGRLSSTRTRPTRWVGPCSRLISIRSSWVVRLRQ